MVLETLFAVMLVHGRSILLVRNRRWIRRICRKMIGFVASVGMIWTLVWKRMIIGMERVQVQVAQIQEQIQVQIQIVQGAQGILLVSPGQQVFGMSC